MTSSTHEDKGPKFESFVTAENYSDLAVKTEAPVTEEMKERVIAATPIIRELMLEQVLLSEKLDVLKKHIFYGKGKCPITEGSYETTAPVAERITETNIVRLLHASIGLSTETGEILMALYDHVFNGDKLDEVNLFEEFGDASWYTGIGCYVLRKTLAECLQLNIDKLQLRYPEKFTKHSAINRNIESERALLER